MRKTTFLEQNLVPDKLPPRPWRTISIFAFCVVITPIAFELVLRHFARWRTILGRSMEVRTPILNWIEVRAEGAREAIRNTMANDLPRISWRPESMLPIIAGILLFAMLLMRRSHRFHR